MHPFSKAVVTATVAIVAIALLATSALAAQNVANPAQKGSLIIFPAIDVRPGNTTVVTISNDGNTGVDVKCYYVNETKFRSDVVFRLTKKQTVSWDTATGASDPLGSLQPFPTDTGSFPGNPFLGELICFAVNPAGSAQISHNHLSGDATVTTPGGSYQYSSWNFSARGVARGQVVGTAGRLDLTGAIGAYDACPAYNLIRFAPTTVVDGTVADTRVSVSGCLQDLRQDFTPHFTKLEFNIWNANEVKFTGAWECANSVESFLLSTLDVLPDNASASVLGTTVAQAQITGVASTRCGGSENTGILAVTASVSTAVEAPEAALHGTTANHAGISAVAGFVLWDPQDDVVPEKK